MLTVDNLADLFKKKINKKVSTGAGFISDLGALLTSAVVMKQLFLYIPWALEDNCCGLREGEAPKTHFLQALAV